MAISINRVYQTVQRLLNVEQRGQLPPADFNYFANLAQLDLFGKLFTDKAHFMASQKGRISDLPMGIQEKIDVFVTEADLVQPEITEAIYTLPTDLYSIQDVYYRSSGTSVIAEKIDHKMSQYILSSPLTAPSLTFPKYRRFNSSAKGIGNIEVYPTTVVNGTIRVDYVRQPEPPVWNSIMIGGTPLFNVASSTDFGLHPSMEDELVDKTLYYSALSTRQNDIAASAQNEISQDNQIDKQ